MLGGRSGAGRFATRNLAARRLRCGSRTILDFTIKFPNNPHVAANENPIFAVYSPVGFVSVTGITACSQSSPV
jgi:hypothetical protein